MAMQCSASRLETLRTAPVKNSLKLFSFADTFADFNAAEQRQHGQQGRVKRPNVHSSAKLNVSLQVVFTLCSAIRRAGRTSLALVDAPALFSL